MREYVDPMTAKSSSIPSALLFAILLSLWLILNDSISPVLLGAGAIVSYAIARMFTVRAQSWSGRVWRSLALTPRALWHFAAYLGVFAVELVRANITMMRYVYARHIDIRPGIVRVNTRLRSPMGRLALTSSIALTPGSLVVAVEGDTLYIHWLDVVSTDPQEAAQKIAGPFEKHLEAVFG